MAKTIQKKSNKAVAVSPTLFKNITQLIEHSKLRVNATVNAELTHMYWNIGQAIKQNILQNKRADYGEQIVTALSDKLTELHGRGWSKQQLWNCLYTVEIFPDFKILSTLSGELSWSHIKEIIYLPDELQRSFYIEMCRHEKWSVRQLRERTDSMLYERTAISRKPKKLIKEELAKLKSQHTITPDLIFRDPYFLDFLGLADTYSEKDMETAIIAELQKFIIELGMDFAFLARQKRITIDNEDYYMDLLFYHRKLRRLVVIDLKLTKFKPGYKSQMELYLNWLNKYERAEGEETPIGLILCAAKSDEHIELLTLNNGNIRVAQYLTGLPSKKILQQKFHQAIHRAQSKVTVAPEKKKTRQIADFNN